MATLVQRPVQAWVLAQPAPNNNRYIGIFGRREKDPKHFVPDPCFSGIEGLRGRVWSDDDGRFDMLEVPLDLWWGLRATLLFNLLQRADSASPLLQPKSDWTRECLAAIGNFSGLESVARPEAGFNRMELTVVGEAVAVPTNFALNADEDHQGPELIDAVRLAQAVDKWRLAGCHGEQARQLSRMQAWTHNRPNLDDMTYVSATVLSQISVFAAPPQLERMVSLVNDLPASVRSVLVGAQARIHHEIPLVYSATNEPNLFHDDADSAPPAVTFRG